MNERLKATFQEQYPGTWENGKMAYMRYNSANIWYQARGIHYEGTTLNYDHDDIKGLDEVNFPIIAQGITAYILRRLDIVSVSDDKICFDYYQKCLSKYKDVEKNKRGAYQRDLDSEFYPIHLREENEKINKSELLFSYLTKDESDVIREFVKYYFEFIEVNYLHREDELMSHETTNKEMSKVINILDNKVEIRPIFSVNSIKTIEGILKPYFDQKHHVDLHELLDKGINISSPIVFLDNANRLTDAFQQLIERGIITGCNKQHLENWIIKNFRYRSGKEERGFNPRTINKSISGHVNICKNKLIEITENGEIIRVQDERRKNMNNY